MVIRLTGLVACNAANPRFFLDCVGVAGLHGAVTVGSKILFVQALPAALAIATALAAR